VEGPVRVERWSPPDLRGAVASVTGASYGVGRGVAEVLGECGATVYLTGRGGRRWTVDETAELVAAAGGTGIPVRVDHTDDVQVAELFTRIGREMGRLDLLVNNVWQWGPREGYDAPTVEQPPARWDAMFGVGVRSHFVATRFALPLMLRRRRGLIVLTQERPGDDRRFLQNVVVDAAAAAMQRMARYLAAELRDDGITAVLVYLGWVRTANMGMGFDPSEVGMSEEELLAVTQSPALVGRAIAMLATDPDVIAKSGRTLYAGDLATEYGFTDVDGRVPRYEGGE
jgi:NAD(P)-dependent dehydrogenase (short-subunit alcohol dehydrogenase family)